MKDESTAEGTIKAMRLWMKIDKEVAAEEKIKALQKDLDILSKEAKLLSLTWKDTSNTKTQSCSPNGG